MFVAYTLVVAFVDVREIGAGGTRVGLAARNEAAFAFFGVNITLYAITDWIGVVAIAVAFGFAVAGVCSTYSAKKPAQSRLRNTRAGRTLYRRYRLLSVFRVRYRELPSDNSVRKARSVVPVLARYDRFVHIAERDNGASPQDKKPHAHYRRQSFFRGARGLHRRRQALLGRTLADGYNRRNYPVRGARVVLLFVRRATRPKMRLNCCKTIVFARDSC